MRGDLLGDVAASGRRTAAVARHQAVLLRRAPGQVIVYTVMAGVLTVFTEPMTERLPAPGVTAPPGARAAAGMLVFCSLFMAGVAGAAVVDERGWRTAERLRSTPARPWEVLAGKALPMLGLLLTQQAIVLATASVLYPTGFAAHWPRLLAVGAAWSGCVLGLGLLMAAAVTTAAQLSTVKDLTALLLSATGGAVVPLGALPTWIQPAAPYSPAYWAVSGYLGGSGPTLRWVALLVATGALAFATAAHLGAPPQP